LYHARDRANRQFDSLPFSLTCDQWAETNNLEERAHKVLHLDYNDVEAFRTYIKATRLFYDCLQLAYTPDRRAFEDRILLLPPLDA